uniref:Major facilitator superfamily associated domain-containing protein n=1 Tax=Timema tahoe TaxID=61484 RepID=A0A7R9IRT6_9NEOP|nr:unnamed protein product [Timema tahoe]
MFIIITTEWGPGCGKLQLDITLCLTVNEKGCSATLTGLHVYNNHRVGKSQRDITLCLTIVEIGCFPALDTLREEYTTPKTARSPKTPTSVPSNALYVLYPYLTIHMRELGINVEETAIMSAVTPIVAIVMPPLAGMVADRIGDFKKTHFCPDDSMTFLGYDGITVVSIGATVVSIGATVEKSKFVIPDVVAAHDLSGCDTTAL